MSNNDFSFPFFNSLSKNPQVSPTNQGSSSNQRKFIPLPSQLILPPIPQPALRPFALQHQGFPAHQVSYPTTVPASTSLHLPELLHSEVSTVPRQQFSNSQQIVPKSLQVQPPILPATKTGQLPISVKVSIKDDLIEDYLKTCHAFFRNNPGVIIKAICDIVNGAEYPNFESNKVVLINSIEKIKSYLDHFFNNSELCLDFDVYNKNNLKPPCYYVIFGPYVRPNQFRNKFSFLWSYVLEKTSHSPSSTHSIRTALLEYTYDSIPLGIQLELFNGAKLSVNKQSLNLGFSTLKGIKQITNPRFNWCEDATHPGIQDWFARIFWNTEYLLELDLNADVECSISSHVFNGLSNNIAPSGLLGFLARQICSKIDNCDRAFDLLETRLGSLIHQLIPNLFFYMATHQKYYISNSPTIREGLSKFLLKLSTLKARNFSLPHQDVIGTHHYINTCAIILYKFKFFLGLIGPELLAKVFFNQFQYWGDLSQPVPNPLSESTHLFDVKKTLRQSRDVGDQDSQRFYFELNKLIPLEKILSETTNQIGVSSDSSTNNRLGQVQGQRSQEIYPQFYQQLMVNPTLPTTSTLVEDVTDEFLSDQDILSLIPQNMSQPASATVVPSLKTLYVSDKQQFKSAQSLYKQLCECVSETWTSEPLLSHIASSLMKSQGGFFIDLNYFSSRDGFKNLIQPFYEFYRSNNKNKHISSVITDAILFLRIGFRSGSLESLNPIFPGEDTNALSQLLLTQFQCSLPPLIKNPLGFWENNHKRAEALCLAFAKNKLLEWRSYIENMPLFWQKESQARSIPAFFCFMQEKKYMLLPMVAQFPTGTALESFTDDGQQLALDILKNKIDTSFGDLTQLKDGVEVTPERLEIFAKSAQESKSFLLIQSVSMPKSSIGGGEKKRKRESSNPPGDVALLSEIGSLVHAEEQEPPHKKAKTEKGQQSSFKSAASVGLASFSDKSDFWMNITVEAAQRLVDKLKSSKLKKAAFPTGGLSSIARFIGLARNSLSEITADLDVKAVVRYLKLKGYQIEALHRRMALSAQGIGGLYASDPGLGKTLQVLSFILTKQMKGKHPAIIIVPRNLVAQWVEAYHKAYLDLGLGIWKDSFSSNQEQCICDILTAWQKLLKTLQNFKSKNKNNAAGKNDLLASMKRIQETILNQSDAILLWTHAYAECERSLALLKEKNDNGVDFSFLETWKEGLGINIKHTNKNVNLFSLQSKYYFSNLGKEGLMLNPYLVSSSFDKLLVCVDKITTLESIPLSVSVMLTTPNQFSLWHKNNKYSDQVKVFFGGSVVVDEAHLQLTGDVMKQQLQDLLSLALKAKSPIQCNLSSGTFFVNSTNELEMFMQFALGSCGSNLCNTSEKLALIRLASLKRLEKKLAKDNILNHVQHEQDVRKTLKKALVPFELSKSFLRELFLSYSVDSERVKNDWDGCIPIVDRQEISFQLTDEQKKLISQMGDERLMTNKPKYQSIMVHPALTTDDKKLKLPKDDGKVKEFISRSGLLTKLFEKGGGFEQEIKKKNPVLIFVDQIAHTDLLNKLINAAYKSDRVWIRSLHGEESLNERNKIIDEFKKRLANTSSPEGGVLIATTKTGGVGLNFPNAAIVFIDEWWNNTTLVQAISRARRVGSKGRFPCFIFKNNESGYGKFIEQVAEKKRLECEYATSNSNQFEEVKRKFIDFFCSYIKESSNSRSVLEKLFNDKLWLSVQEKIKSLTDLRNLPVQQPQVQLQTFMAPTPQQLQSKPMAPPPTVAADQRPAQKATQRYQEIRDQCIKMGHSIQFYEGSEVIFSISAPSTSSSTTCKPTFRFLKEKDKFFLLLKLAKLKEVPFCKTINKDSFYKIPMTSADECFKVFLWIQKGDDVAKRQSYLCKSLEELAKQMTNWTDVEENPDLFKKFLNQNDQEAIFGNHFALNKS